MAGAPGAAARGEGRFTVDDYFSWDDDQRWELLGGVAHAMTPAPTWDHQATVTRLAISLAAALAESGCEIAVSPIDVVLSPEDLVQPDLVVLCDASKVTDRGFVRGAPDLVVEVLSPSTALRDRREKKALYARAGVPEVLLVDHRAQVLERFELGEAGAYGPAEVLGPEDTLNLAVGGGVSVTLAEVFPGPEGETGGD